MTVLSVCSMKNQSGASLSKSVYMETAGAPAYTCPQSQLLPGIIFETGKIILLLLTSSARFPQLPHHGFFAA
jgi:hypothetical protein